MAEQKIEFRKIRDFGENLNDTFLFIRQNFKSLLSTFFAICGVLMLIQAILSGIYQSDSFGMFNDIINGRTVRQRSMSEVFNAGYFLMLLSMLVTYIAMQVALGAYIKFYVDNNGSQPSIEDVWRIFKKYFLKVFFYSIPILILTVIGLVFCIAPGIWIWVVFVPFTMIIIIEDEDFGGAFNRCFMIVKENFWISLAVYLVAFLIYNFSSGIISIVVGAIAGIITYLTTHDVATTAGIVTSFFNVFSFIFYIVYVVAVAFHYFNLVEIRDGTGILGRINTIGDNTNSSNTEEEY